MSSFASSYKRTISTANRIHLGTQLKYQLLSKCFVVLDKKDASYLIFYTTMSVLAFEVYVKNKTQFRLHEE